MRKQEATASSPPLGCGSTRARLQLWVVQQARTQSRPRRTVGEPRKVAPLLIEASVSSTKAGTPGVKRSRQAAPAGTAGGVGGGPASVPRRPSAHRSHTATAGMRVWEGRAPAIVLPGAVALLPVGVTFTVRASGLRGCLRPEREEGTEETHRIGRGTGSAGETSREAGRPGGSEGEGWGARSTPGVKRRTRAWPPQATLR